MMYCCGEMLRARASVSIRFTDNKIHAVADRIHGTVTHTQTQRMELRWGLTSIRCDACLCNCSS